MKKNIISEGKWKWLFNYDKWRKKRLKEIINLFEEILFVSIHSDNVKNILLMKNGW